LAIGHVRHHVVPFSLAFEIDLKPYRAKALLVLGYVIRKQPAWLYRVMQHGEDRHEVIMAFRRSFPTAIMKELIRALKTEEDLVILMSGLLALLAVLPVLPAYVAPYLTEVFEVFSRVAAWRYQHIRSLPDVQQVHVQVGLFSLFHRLYGLFPCNFLSFLRTQYSDGNKDNRVRRRQMSRKPPTYCSVSIGNIYAYHPADAGHSKDASLAGHAQPRSREDVVQVQENGAPRHRGGILQVTKAVAGWTFIAKYCIACTFRYSLVSQESAMEDQEPPALDVGAYNSTIRAQDSATDVQGGRANAGHQDPLWTPGRRVGLSTPPPAQVEISGTAAVNALARLSMDSPPETAIEATPETTPFVTPVKDNTFRFSAPAPAMPIGQSAGKPESTSGTGSHAPSPRPFLKPSASPAPSFKEPSPFRVLDTGGAGRSAVVGRRDSIFEQSSHSHLSSRLARLGAERESADAPGSVKEEDVSAAASRAEAESNVGLVKQTEYKSPSPVKFTSARPEQFPIKPEPERPAVVVSGGGEAIKRKMLSLENLKDALVPDYSKEEEDDDEVSKLTNFGEAVGGGVSTRHITPQICQDSAATSRTTSSSQIEQAPSTTPLQWRPVSGVDAQLGEARGAADAGSVSGSDCGSGGVHPPSKDTVDDFVRQVKGRIRFFSVCGPATDIAAEVAAVQRQYREVEGDAEAKRKPRSNSCPDERHITDVVEMRKRQGVDQDTIDDDEPIQQAGGEERGQVHSSVQTDELMIFPYEHLFPSALPQQWFAGQAGPEGAADDQKKSCNPYALLDTYVDALSCKSTPITGGEKQEKSLRDEVTLLHNLLLFERYRREILGHRNRRLLGKTKSSRILEEQKNALVRPIVTY